MGARATDPSQSSNAEQGMCMPAQSLHAHQFARVCMACKADGSITRHALQQHRPASLHSTLSNQLSLLLSMLVQANLGTARASLAIFGHRPSPCFFKLMSHSNCCELGAADQTFALSQLMDAFAVTMITSCKLVPCRYCCGYHCGPCSCGSHWACGVATP